MIGLRILLPVLLAAAAWPAASPDGARASGPVEADEATPSGPRAASLERVERRRPAGRVRAALARRYRKAVEKRGLAYASLARTAPSTEARLRAECETSLGAHHPHQVRWCVVIKWPHPPGAQRALEPVMRYTAANRAVNGIYIRMIRTDPPRQRRLRALCEARIPAVHHLDVEACVAAAW